MFCLPLPMSTLSIFLTGHIGGWYWYHINHGGMGDGRADAASKCNEESQWRVNRICGFG